MFFFSKFRKCIGISLKPYKFGLSKVVKLKTILFYFIQQKIYFARFHFYNTYFEGQGPLEGEGVEVGTSKYLPRTYFSL